MGRAKRAIIMAAGRGNRLSPITDQLAKPMIPVHGMSFLERMVLQLREHGVEDIFVVTGYRANDFEIIADQHEHVHLLYNPYWEHCNNISSLYVARDLLEDTFILDGDQWIANPSIFQFDFTISSYAAMRQYGSTREWLLSVEHGRIASCSRDGGHNGWQLFSLSYWTAMDGKKLKEFVLSDFQISDRQQLYWDDIALFLHPKDFSLGIREICQDDIIEIDTLSELIAFDDSYCAYSI